MLHREVLAFAVRMKQLSKNIEYKFTPEAVHGFDKGPNPMSTDPKVDHFYKKACIVLQRDMETVSQELLAVV